MNKATADQAAYRTRTANHSTKQSRRGTDILGWGKGEAVLSPKEQRDSLIARKNWIDRQLGDLRGPGSSASRATLIREKNEADQAIIKLNRKLGRGKLGEMSEYILQILKAELPRFQWEAAVDKARKMRDEAARCAESAPPSPASAPLSDDLDGEVP